MSILADLMYNRTMYNQHCDAIFANNSNPKVSPNHALVDPDFRNLPPPKKMIPARGPQTVFGQCYIKYICGNLKFANRLKLRSKDALD